MKSRKSVRDRTDPCGTPLLIDLKDERWPSTTAAIERPERKSERKIYSERGKFGNQSFVPDSIESLRYVQRHSKRFTEMPKSERRERRSPVERFLRKPYWRSEIRLEELRFFQIFLLRIDSKTLERMEVKEIGR